MTHVYEQLSKGSTEEIYFFEYEEEDKLDNLEDKSLED